MRCALGHAAAAAVFVAGLAMEATPATRRANPAPVARVAATDPSVELVGRFKRNSDGASVSFDHPGTELRFTVVNTSAVPYRTP